MAGGVTTGGDDGFVMSVLRNWWALLIRGLAAIAFGIIALVWPNITITALLIIFGVYVIFVGIFSLISSVVLAREGRRWKGAVIRGVLEIAIGVVLFAWPHATAVVLLYIIAILALGTGIIELIAAGLLVWFPVIRWMLGIAGVISIVFAIVAFASPSTGAVALSWLIGIYALFFGVSLVLVAVWMKRFAGRLETERGKARPIEVDAEEVLPVKEVRRLDEGRPKEEGRPEDRPDK
jgi:uncharacterized membrane protein HdeD (DUF308 family)